MDTLIHNLRDITIRRISVSELDNNVYLLTAKKTGSTTSYATVFSLVWQKALWVMTAL